MASRADGSSEGTAELGRALGRFGRTLSTAGKGRGCSDHMSRLKPSRCKSRTPGYLRYRRTTAPQESNGYAQETKGRRGAKGAYLRHRKTMAKSHSQGWLCHRNPTARPELACERFADFGQVMPAVAQSVIFDDKLRGDGRAVAQAEGRGGIELLVGELANGFGGFAAIFS